MLGLSSPQSLVNTVWLNNMLHFGLRGGKEQTELQWGDFVLKSDSEGRQYLEYSVERQKKTRPGENPRNQRQVKLRRGGSRIFLGWGALVSCSNSTPINPFFFCRIPVVLENRRSSQGGGGAPPAPSP